MGASTSYSTAVLDLADSWRRLAQAQVALTKTETAARNAQPLEVLRHEAVNAFEVSLSVNEESVTARITPHAGRADRLHIWATPDLLVIRAETPAPVEHLVRLPAPVAPDNASVTVHDGTMTVILERRADLPVVVWPAPGRC